MSRLRFGLHSGQQYQSIAEVRTLWKRAEDLGFEWVSLFDHWRPPMGGPDGPCLDGMITVAAAARATRSLTIGLLVTPAHMHNVGRLAMQVAALYQATEGRLAFGLGAGAPDLAYESFGIARPSLAHRVEAVDSLVPMLKALLKGDVLTGHGRFHNLNDARIRPIPSSPVPIVVGADRERMLAVAGRNADIWNTVVSTPTHYRWKLDLVRRAQEHAGRQPHEVRPSLTFRTAIGGSAEIRRRQNVVEHTQSQDLTEYVSWGSARQCLDALAPYVDAGARDLLFGLRPPLDWHSAEEFISTVAPALSAYAG